MRDVIRLVLVDPNEESRNNLQRLLGGLSQIWLAEVFSTYHDTARRISEISPELTILTVDHDPEQAIEVIAGVTRNNPSAVVLPASCRNDSALILRSIRAGAREFLTLPTEPAELLECMLRLLQGREGSKTSLTRGPRIVSVTGACGGVGATSLAVNLASILASSKQHETILLDLDLMFGTVDACLDVTPNQTLTNVIQNFERLDLMLLKRSIFQHSSALYVLPHPTAMQDAASIEAETLARLLGVLRAAFSTVVIDTSKGLQSTDFTAFEMSDTILVVLQLNLLCLRNTARLLSLFQQFEGLIERVKLVENRSGSAQSEISSKKAEETLKMPISWRIPEAHKVFQEARIKGTSLAEVAKGSRPHYVLLEMIRSFWPTLEDESRPRKGLFAAFF
jgi:pilus assembly protein CpaE